jgi:hypothetical protein
MTFDPTFQFVDSFSQPSDLSFRVVVGEVTRTVLVETHHIASFVCSQEVERPTPFLQQFVLGHRTSEPYPEQNPLWQARVEIRRLLRVVSPITHPNPVPTSSA